MVSAKLGHEMKSNLTEMNSYGKQTNLSKTVIHFAHGQGVFIGIW